MKNPSGAEVENITQRLGAWFLSTRFSKPDPSSLRLRQEIKMLAVDPNVPARPDYLRFDLGTDDGFEEYQKHLSRINNGAPATRVQDAINGILRS